MKTNKAKVGTIRKQSVTFVVKARSLTGGNYKPKVNVDEDERAAFEKGKGDVGKVKYAKGNLGQDLTGSITASRAVRHG